MIAKRAPSQAGMTIIETLIAVVICAMMAGLTAYIFKRQAKNYGDMQVQSQLQVQIKKAEQMMTREITNAGVGLTTGTLFTMNANDLRIEYLDMKGKHCPANNRVAIIFRVATVTGGKALIREKQCNGGATVQESRVTFDDVTLTFRYLRANGTATATSALVRMIAFNIGVQTANTKDLFSRTRTDTVQVWLSRY